MIDFDSMMGDIEDRSADLMQEVNRLKDEASWAYSEYQDLLAELGATDYISALEAINELKAGARSVTVASGNPKVVESASTALTPAELSAILTQSISKALEAMEDKPKAITPAHGTLMTFRDTAGLR
jgi:hypothetical protein